MTYAPDTAVGAVLSDALMAHVAGSPIAGLPATPRATQLQFQAFTVLVRRRLSRTPQPEFLRAHLEEAFERIGIVRSPSRSEAAEMMLRAALGDEAGRTVLAWDAKLMRALLLDLVSVPPASASDIAALVALAETRLRRLRTVTRERSPGWLRWARGWTMSLPADRPDATQAPAPVTPPSSVFGLRLRAMARFDFDAAASMPAEPDDEVVGTMTRRVFTAMVNDRFRLSSTPDQIEAVAAGVSEFAGHGHITPRLVEALIRDVGSQADHSSHDYEAMLFTFVKLVDDLGLFDREIDALIREVE